ncbi:hypothetical protein ANCCAN_29167 [Ancylostoma caninum]|uniref:Uncharacterized protein n=1 Tax=Ancylostoma caninum TaxID=29170 RepID=A0A368EZB1_ANCCA|nr:hypothetical protein ANCCAN_29167 [Ancylostoma caninum]
MFQMVRMETVQQPPNIYKGLLGKRRIHVSCSNSLSSWQFTSGQYLLRSTTS